MLSARLEVMQRDDAHDHRRQCRGNLWVAHVSNMLLTVHFQVVDFRAEGFPHLARRTRKIDHHSIGIDQIHGESMRLEPQFDRIDVLLRYPKVLSKLLW